MNGVDLRVQMPARASDYAEVGNSINIWEKA